MSRNIGGNDNDLSYRYKMPKMITKVEGRGNGIKTRLVNMYDVGKALHRDPAYVTKFFGCELGAQSKISEKNLEYIVNGNHDTKTFESLLDVFIEKYVLCPNCKLPETNLSVKNQSIYSGCNACGHRALLDSNHRIAQYIIKCPPKERDNVQIKASKQQQKSKEDDDLVKTAQALKIKEDSEVNWSTDAESNPAAKALPDDDSTEPADVIRRAVHELDEGGESTVQSVCKLVRSIQRQEKFGNLERTSIVFNALFSENILKELVTPHRKEIIKELCSDPRTYKAFLSSLEVFLESHANLLARLPDILMGIYDAELVPEDAVISHFKSSKQKAVPAAFHEKVMKAAAPFLEWLEQSDEESEEEEEEAEAPVAANKFASVASDDDDDDKPALSGNTSSKVKAFLSKQDDDSDSDVDLDDL